MSTTYTLAQMRLNDENPRDIRDERFAQLVQSLIDFPEMLFLRPAVVDEAGLVLGGNMRTRAKQYLLGLPEPDALARIEQALAKRKADRAAADYPHDPATHLELLRRLFFVDELPVTIAVGLTQAQKDEFVIKDNAAFGEWNWDALANGRWGDAPQLNSWGVNVPAGWGEPEVGNFDDEGIKAKSQYGVIVMCHSELDQESVFTRLTGEGLQCKIVVT
jgi:hypothetical protein